MIKPRQWPQMEFFSRGQEYQGRSQLIVTTFHGDGSMPGGVRAYFSGISRVNVSVNVGEKKQKF